MKKILNFDDFVIECKCGCNDCQTEEEDDKDEKDKEKDGEEVTEDTGAFASLAGTPGMGAPVLASRGITGSGDIGSPSQYKKKKKNARSSHRNSGKRTSRGSKEEGDDLSFSGMERLRKFKGH